MSFKEYKSTVEYGDTVLIYIGYNNILPLIVKKGQTHQTKFGALPHDTLIGKQYGSKIQCPKGWIIILHPTPEFWTMCLPHRTQILYSTDISMIVFQLDLKPGSTVAEAGTGSGSLSHAIIRTILPKGHLYTFEFHKERYMKASEEFIQHQIGDYVTVTHRDVCGEGFQLKNLVDAVFLDLPRPWECIQSAKEAIKKEGGRLCSFSPCIEQVQKTCEELTKLGFTDITTMECLVRNINVQNATLQNITLEEQTAPSFTGDANAETDEFKSKKLKTENADVKTSKKSTDNYCFPAAMPALTMPGHTGFLTFASIYMH
ncbi:tRNA (adenine(58)-N(1))-methyltransferase catalytic subunit TRMT61A [Biomphalaria pfeifferi]|uniref:tRNA (adenine(58)-N(1))-methyltransferase catalytic subunit TRMT61A n=1 Tax=Biomphalaria pfeifferi TaxID=112525 RepID=A0AAD8F3V4_BIOPF|nr:tRNA (adenine(58)-N(1))-methyltransferase catalytic subunit TRMT61A [Biomphalaria pfeifferi]